MQFAVSNATDLPPVWVQGRYTDAGGLDGISTTGIMHHRKVRRPPVSAVSVATKAPLVNNAERWHHEPLRGGRRLLDMDSDHVPWWTLGG